MLARNAFFVNDDPCPRAVSNLELLRTMAAFVAKYIGTTNLSTTIKLCYSFKWSNCTCLHIKSCTRSCSSEAVLSCSMEMDYTLELHKNVTAHLSKWVKLRTPSATTCSTIWVYLLAGGATVDPGIRPPIISLLPAVPCKVTQLATLPALEIPLGLTSTIWALSSYLTPTSFIADRHGTIVLLLLKIHQSRTAASSVVSPVAHN